MVESFITVFTLGLIAGFFFSIPVAGPISILITSNALKGRLVYCVRTALGASIVEFFYVFIAVYGLTSLYSYYDFLIPYILIGGSFFLFYIALKIMKTKFSIKEGDENGIDEDKEANKGGFRTGVLLNITNPSLFLGWLTSSFLLLSFASSVGLNTGGLDIMINKNVTSIEEIAGKEFEALHKLDTHFTAGEDNNSKSQNLLLSSTYSLMVAFGSFLWFYLFSRLIIKYRDKLRVSVINYFVKGLGLVLCGISIYLIYQGFVLL